MFAPHTAIYTHGPALTSSEQYLIHFYDEIKFINMKYLIYCLLISKKLYGCKWTERLFNIILIHKFQ